MHNILTLSNINESDVSKVGQRALDLSNIHKSKLKTPLSFVVPNLLLDEFILQNKLGFEIPKLIDELKKGNSTFEDTYSRIKYLFERATIPEEFKEELQESYSALATGTSVGAQSLLSDHDPTVNLIISPSYVLDSEKFTGILFNIKGFENFLNGLKSCWLSLYSPEHLKFRVSKNIDSFSAGIIVQEFIQPECTVDAYSKSLLGNYEIPISSYFGLPDITGTLVKDHYSISRETFELTTQDVKTQEHILLKNTKSGTLIKRSLGKKGETQKLPTKQIYEVARAIDKSSRLIHKHFRILLFVCESENLIFFVDSFGERDSDLESSEHKKSKFEQELEKPKNSESLAELINAPVVEDKEDTLEPTLENKSPSKAIILEETDEEETLISKSNEGKEEKTVTEVTKEKIIILDDNDDFILSQKNDAPLPKTEDLEINPAKNTPIAQEKIDISEKPKNSEKKINPDNEFFMSIILDLEPALDQEILKRYQDKFGVVSSDFELAIEQLNEEELPEKEQIFKLKNLKDMLERGETINLDVFLEVTDRLRKIL